MATVTKTLKYSGGDYSTFAAWYAAEKTDLVSDGDTHILEVYDDFPSGLTEDVSISDADWTTDATHRLIIRAASGQGHAGVYGAGFTVNGTSSNSTTFSISCPYVTVQGFAITRTGTGNPSNTLYVEGTKSDGVIIDSMIVTGSNRRCIAVVGYSSLGNEVCYIRNCLSISTGSIAAGGAGGGVYTSNTRKVEVQNCTEVLGSDSDARGVILSANTDTVKATNCAVVRVSGSGICYVFSGSASVDDAINCATSDSTLTGATSPQTGLGSSDFVNYAGNDFTPATSGKLDGTGTDLSAYFTTDITGATRTQWDIGCYGIISAGGFQAAWARGSNQILGGFNP